MRTVRAARVEGYQCQGAQGVVEAALAFVLVTVLVGMAVTVAWGAHAQNVVTAAVQGGGRAASAIAGHPARGLAVAPPLLQAGLGSGAGLVDLRAGEDSAGAIFTAPGGWAGCPGPG